MGILQSQTRSNMEERVDQNVTTHLDPDDSENGLIIMDKYIPEELLAEILKHVSCKTLLKCQLVCKRWRLLIQSYVWRKKAECTIGRTLPSTKSMNWVVYYSICKAKPFERNLLRNHSGKNRTRNWTILNNGGNQWTVESKPLGAPPLPMNEPVFNGKQTCFVTSFERCRKEQVICLQHEGLPGIIMDEMQPPIMISEWYCSRWDCPAEYECSVKLLNEHDHVVFAQQFEFRDVIVEEERRSKWHYVSHTFRNYGPGVRKIAFCHGGKDRSWWAGHYGSKMAGACVCIKLPEV